jgi:hypothetical protein
MGSVEPSRSLDQQREEFAGRRFLAMPIAGAIVWAVIGVGGAILPPFPAVLVLFIGTGSIVYLGMFISRYTGENFLDRSKPKNTFDGLFFHTVGMALLVYAIAIPFFLVDHTSLPLTVGILTGLMWMPLSWILRHWVGLFHAIVRTGLVVVAWYLFPDLRFVVIPAVIVLVYIATILALERRWRNLRASRTAG